MLLALLVGCGTPTETTATTFVGRLLDSTGYPIANQRVETLEQGHDTDGLGQITLPVQSPDGFVSVPMGDVFYRRVLTESDLGTVVDLQLPRMGETSWRCDLPRVCPLRVRWELGEHFIALANPTCVPGESVVGTSWPQTEPAEVVCDEQAVRVADGVVTEMPRTVRVRVDWQGACVVRVDDRLAIAGEDGTYTAEAVGQPLVVADCSTGRDDILPLPPVRVPADGHEVTVAAPAPLRVQLGTDPSSVTALFRSADGSASWSIPFPVWDEEVVLPAVSQAGVYQLLAPGGVPPVGPVPTGEAGVLTTEGTGASQRWTLVLDGAQEGAVFGPPR